MEILQALGKKKVIKFLSNTWCNNFKGLLVLGCFYEVDILGVCGRKAMEISFSAVFPNDLRDYL